MGSIAGAKARERAINGNHPNSAAVDLGSASLSKTRAILFSNNYFFARQPSGTSPGSAAAFLTDDQPCGLDFLFTFYSVAFPPPAVGGLGGQQTHSVRVKISRCFQIVPF